MRYDLSKLHAFDSETHLIIQGKLAPNIVCGSSATMQDGGRLLTKEEALQVAKEVLESDQVMVTANGSFDLGVLTNEFSKRGIDILPSIFKAFTEKRIYDVLIAQALDAIEGGHLGKHPNGSAFIHPATGKRTEMYSLDLCVKLVLNRYNAKENDYWRERYAILEKVPLQEWPTEAKQYPIDDSVNTLELAIAQITANDGKGFRNLADLPDQVETAFGLHLGAIWGLRTSKERVDALADKVEKAHVEIVKRFTEYGFIHTGPKRENVVDDQGKIVTDANGNANTKLISPCSCGDWKCKKAGKEDGPAVKRRIATAYGASGTCPICKGTGKVPSAKTKGIIQCDECGATGLDLSTAPGLPRTETGGVSTDRDVLMESGDEILHDYGDNETEKIRETYLPFLRQGIDQPITLKPNVLVASGRTSYQGLIQTFPRSGGARECFKARDGYVYSSIDYSALELCLAGSTRIFTSEGMIPIKQLVGKEVLVASRFTDENNFSEQPAFHKANVFFTGVKNTLNITTVDGRKISLTENHPVLVQKSKRERNWKNKLDKKCMCGCGGGTPYQGLGQPRLFIEGHDRKLKTTYEWVEANKLKVGDNLVSGAINLFDNTTSSKIDRKFYAFGQFSGDGWFCADSLDRINTGTCTAGNEKFILDNVIPAWEQLIIEAESFIETRYDNRYGNNPIQIKKGSEHREVNIEEFIEKYNRLPIGTFYISISKPHLVRLLQQKYGYHLGRAPVKRFPDCYWKASKDEKASYLRGLIDADGCITYKTRRSVSVTAANDEFARDYMLALTEFGINSRMTTHFLKKRNRYQTIIQVRGVRELEKFAKHILFIDQEFKSVKAERLFNVLNDNPDYRMRYEGFEIKAIEEGGCQEVYNLEVPTSRQYIAEGLVVHNCSLGQLCLWIVGHSKMAEVINETKDPGFLHTAFAGRMIGKTDEEMRELIKIKDKTAKDTRQATKCANFGLPGGMGAAKLVITNRKKNVGVTKGPDGYEYSGIRFCILIGGETTCGHTKITEWKRRPIPPTCRRCLEVVEQRLKVGFFRQWPEVREYLNWISKRNENGETTIWSLCPSDIRPESYTRIRGGLKYSDASNSGFQSLAADGAKAAWRAVIRECYTDRTSPLWGTRPIMFIHDEILSEMPLETAHLAAPRMSEIMVREMRRYIPDVHIVAEPCLMKYWYKSAEPSYDGNGKLIPWEPKESK